MKEVRQRRLLLPQGFHSPIYEPHRLAFLPRQLACAPLVDFLTANQFLSPRTRSILTTGTGAPFLAPAIAEFNRRPPSLESDEQLAEFLGCSGDAVLWLMKYGVISKPQLGHGFDVEQVLIAQERLSRFVSLQDMDRRFDVPGLTKALIDWHVIPMSTSPRDSWMAVDLTHVAQLLDRLLTLSTGSLVLTHSHSVRLCETNFAKRDFTEAIVTVVARALRLDMEGLAWQSPFSLRDLYVAVSDANRLESIGNRVARELNEYGP